MDGDDGPQSGATGVAEDDLLVVVASDAVEDVHPRRLVLQPPARSPGYWTTREAIWWVSWSWQYTLNVPGWVALIFTSATPGGISVWMP